MDEPLAARVSRYIRLLITEGRLKPGDRIRQEEVAHRVGTSRIPVREALRQLENEGLVNLIPHSGARVAVLDYQAFSEIYRMREAIEPMVIAESITNLDDEQIERLRELMNIVDEAGEGDEPVRWLQADRQFHLCSMSAAPMPEVLDRVEGFWNQTQQYRRAFFEKVKVELEIVSAEHRLLMRAIEQRDAVNAENLQRLHIRRTRMTLSPHMELFN